MVMSENIGIDYGLGMSNIDKDTGIRFGVISQHSLMSEAANEITASGAVYRPHCPYCGDSLFEYKIDIEDDMTCPACNKTIEYSDDCYGDEPSFIEYREQTPDGEIVIIDCLDSDLMITKSPYYTLAPYCSPCCPGAGNLDDSDGTSGVPTYCLPLDWFDKERPIGYVPRLTKFYKG
jgi:hypothetical protein